MKFLISKRLWFSLVGFLVLVVTIHLNSKSVRDEKDKNDTRSKNILNHPGKVVKTDAEWKENLTPEQYAILRKAGTERPNGPVYEKFKKQGGGTYFCAGCDSELFSSKEKFDSRCGWPSFYDPSEAKNVITSVDYLMGYPRTEVLCAICEGHLGHVFTGEGFDTPTDKRYCINGTVLKFVPFETSESMPSEKKSLK